MTAQSCTCTILPKTGASNQIVVFLILKKIVTSASICNVQMASGRAEIMVAINSEALSLDYCSLYTTAFSRKNHLCAVAILSTT